MKGKILSGLLAFTMIFGCGSALAEVPNGTVVMDGMGYSLEYLNSHPREFKIGLVKSLLIKLPNGKWADARSEKILDKSQIPEITYTDDEGNTKVYAEHDGDIVEGKIIEKDSKVDVDEKEYKVIEVSNSEELSKAIGSNRKIVMKKGDYKLIETDKKYVYHDRENNTSSMVIKGVKNLIIEGESSDKEGFITKLSVEDKEVNDIIFRDCKNITLRKMMITDLEKERWGNGPSIIIEECENFSIDSVIIRDSSNGFGMNSSKKVEIRDSIIENVIMGAISAYESSDIKVINSSIRNNKSHTQVYLLGCIDVLFQECSFINNSSVLGGFSEYTSNLIYIVKSDDVNRNSGRCLTIEKCNFEDNRLDSLYGNISKYTVKLKDNKFEGNKFD